MKSFWKSKTIWLNALTLAVGVIGYLSSHELIADNAAIVAALVAVQGGLNVILRFFTWQPLKV